MTAKLTVMDDQPTGAAFIYVNDSTGDNAIIVYAGAAGTIGVGDVEAARDTIAQSNVFVTQLEQPVEAARHALEIARNASVTTIFNPAPAEPSRRTSTAFVTSLFRMRRKLPRLSAFQSIRLMMPSARAIFSCLAALARPSSRLARGACCFMRRANPFMCLPSSVVRPSIRPARGMHSWVDLRLRFRVAQSRFGRCGSVARPPVLP